MIKLRNWIIAGMFALSFGGTTVALVLPDTASAAGTSNTCSNAPKFLTFPQWYRGLTVGSGDTKADCEIASPADVGGMSIFIWRIVLNVIDIMLQAGAYIMVAFILTAGFKLLTSEGQPDRARGARNTITMAAIGLAITIASVAGLNFISSVFIFAP